MRIPLLGRRHLLSMIGGTSLAGALLLGLWSGTPVHSQPSQPLSPTAGYGIFSRPAVSADTPPTILTEGSFVSRQIPTADATLRQWAIASGGSLCVQVEAQEDGEAVQPRACNTVENLDSNQQLLVLGIGGTSASPPSLSDQEEATVGASTAPIPQLLVGLAPDGVDQVSVTFTDGSTETVHISANGFHLYTNGRAPSALTWTSPTGQHRQAL